MSEFIPKESDKEWMRNLFRMLNVGGTWGTSWAIYKKIDENTLATTLGMEIFFPKEVIEDNINRVKIVCEAVGIKYEDRRKENLDEYTK